MNRYIRQTLITTTLLMALVSGFNWLANPYLVFHSPVIEGINHFITENYYKQLLFKPYQLRNIQPRSVIIGASQSGVAFNPDLLPQPAYNLAVGGSTAYLQYRLLQEAVTTNPALENVILETPFFAFNDSDPNNLPGRDPELEQRLTVHADGTPNKLQPAYALQEKLTALVSWDVLRASGRMITKQQAVASQQRGSFIQLRNGQWQQQPPPTASTRQLIENSWKKSIFNDWLPAPEHHYTLPDSNHGAMANYRDSLLLLHANHIKATIVIAPMHASLLMALQEAGLWTTFQQWKHMLVSINESVARQTGQPAFPVYDYAIINPLTSEALPAGSSTQRLQWFNDSMHPSPAFGTLILHEILTGQPVNGRQLESMHVDTQLAGDEQAVTHYTGLHPQHQTAIRTLLANDPDTNLRLSP